MNLQNRLELSVDDDVDRLLEWIIEMHFHSQVAFMYQIEVGTVATIRCDIKQGVPFRKFLSCDIVSFVLKHLSRSIGTEFRLQRFCRHLLTVNVQC